MSSKILRYLSFLFCFLSAILCSEHEDDLLKATFVNIFLKKFCERVPVLNSDEKIIYRFDKEEFYQATKLFNSSPISSSTKYLVELITKELNKKDTAPESRYKNFEKIYDKFNSKIIDENKEECLKLLKMVSKQVLDLNSIFSEGNQNCYFHENIQEAIEKVKSDIVSFKETNSCKVKHDHKNDKYTEHFCVFCSISKRLTKLQYIIEQEIGCYKDFMDYEQHYESKIRNIIKESKNVFKEKIEEISKMSEEEFKSKRNLLGQVKKILMRIKLYLNFISRRHSDCYDFLNKILDFFDEDAKNDKLINEIITKN